MKTTPTAVQQDTLIVRLPLHPTCKRENTFLLTHVNNLMSWKQKRNYVKVLNSRGIVSLTPWVPSEDELPHLVIDEDEEGIRQGTEPPVDPTQTKKHEDKSPGNPKSS